VFTLLVDTGGPVKVMLVLGEMLALMPAEPPWPPTPIPPWPPCPPDAVALPPPEIDEEPFDWLFPALLAVEADEVRADELDEFALLDKFPLAVPPVPPAPPAPPVPPRETEVEPDTEPELELEVGLLLLVLLVLLPDEFEPEIAPELDDEFCACAMQARAHAATVVRSLNFMFFSEVVDLEKPRLLQEPNVSTSCATRAHGRVIEPPK
jgi:hypothetical protein